MNKLPISVGILSWGSNQSIRNTLEMCRKNRLFDLVEETIIFFQEATSDDRLLAKEYGLQAIFSEENVGIGKAFYKLAEVSNQEFLLLLEHDWELVEGSRNTEKELKAAIELLRGGYDCIRLRHRFKYGYPHYSINRYKGKELDYYDDWIKLDHPHLLDAVHWVKKPHEKWPDKIGFEKGFFTANSRYANWTNNPCLYRKNFYLDVAKDYLGGGIDLEEKISYWWARQGFKVAQGNGLFKHSDKDKYGYVINAKRKLKSLLKLLGGKLSWN